ncbi:MAG: alpha/beta hydrolase [Anaerolineae bacterium]|nr:alpha/beta hydrolase [Anaerolineae bacterium]
MNNLRKYGSTPFTVAVIHGGPGAAGEMAPVARELAQGCGILEPLQTADSLDGQVEELRMVLKDQGIPPLTLIGYSWGAWLGYILTARYPALVKRLILVSSGAFEAHYVSRLYENRLKHLNADEGQEFEQLIRELEDPAVPDKDTRLARLGALASNADMYDPLPHDGKDVRVDGNIYHRVWPVAAEMRRSGELLELGKFIRGPVVAIHGDYDPSPAEGVYEPLSAVLDDFRFILLPNCGHTPWHERQAKDKFYQIIKEEISFIS